MTDIGRAGMVMKGNYNSASTYEALDVVSYQNGTYIAKQNVPTNTAPSNTTYWQAACTLPGTIWDIYNKTIGSIGNFKESDPFVSFTAPKDIVVIANVTKTNTAADQNVYFYINSSMRAVFNGMHVPYASTTLYIPMKQGDVLTISANGNWAYHEMYAYYYEI